MLLNVKFRRFLPLRTQKAPWPAARALLTLNASLEFRRARWNKVQIVFPGGAYVGKNTVFPASVGF